ncbi:hypothetical protein vB_PsyM_KIL3b_0040 [Pseudomonas phage vB_PsyM_KIL3b]|uniref:Uncharacterized protein n=4 Tax=Pseudomonas phage vB_PsyM_KIL1 TaxID=1777065 RepID=A0A142IDZ5_9CAUD|nr:hypothetical protein BH774_gp159 [Pseudomonas phage vB_PsyM_KIL1]AMR57290.1 hypothetical protein vB_PsyM_KIL1_0040 [Pseudomonas phage vB_PsyM_KIL1]AMR57450.1 hypothetical protein vB_PsyM_KIL2_0041 [Pseudomonas phage vB_PsyM_KIL2]AMR57610.1 hypothetical protein vB_PsyM_KIL3_0040 [Pseudomonas phage vB_PsyM_KIL3]AMR58108.1 hypothetical protein vB_PsyM_KIL3b_0040 [Pseudomonas phage vB_PsyM_KIL3b]
MHQYVTIFEDGTYKPLPSERQNSKLTITALRLDHFTGCLESSFESAMFSDEQLVTHLTPRRLTSSDMFGGLLKDYNPESC